ncbi:MAG: right-handed parallel beta-helix repeat-containing protein [Fibrobacterota bacterium]
MEIKTTAVILVLSAGLLLAETHRITPNMSINQTIISAQSGDTLLLSPGKYEETVSLPRNITLRGDSPYNTILRGSGREPVLRASRNSKIENLTIEEGSNGVFTRSRGVEISSCIIRRNRLSGIMAINFLPDLSNTVFINNSSHGITAQTLQGAGSISSCSFIKNDRSALALSGTAPVKIVSSLFYHNGFEHFTGTAKKITAQNSLFYPKQEGISSKDNLIVKPTFASLRRRSPDYSCSSHPAYGASLPQY